jgi:hypothetical protein
VRFFRAAALLALTLGLVAAVSACGNSGSGAASGAAVYAPASAAIFATVDTDTEGAQWQALDALLAKFPDGEGAIDKALGEIGAEEGLDFETDIRPAVGAELAIVGFDADGDEVVLLTQPEDPEKLKKIVATGDEPGVTEELDDGWWAAGSQKSLDRFDDARKSGDSLADDDAYRNATEDLFEDAIATIYVNGRLVEQTNAVLDELSGAQSALAKCVGGDDASGASFAAAARIEDDGVRVQGDIASTVVPTDAAGSLDLDTIFRSGALAYVTASGLGDGIRKVVDCVSSNDPTTAQTLAQVQLGLGVSLDDDIAALFDGSTGVAIYAPAPDTGYTALTPVVVFATEVDHEDEAMALIEQLVDRAGGLMSFMGEERSITLEDAGISGVDARVLKNEGKPVLYIGTHGGALVVSNSEAGLAALTSGSSLAEDPEYTDSRTAAGMPSDAGAVVYVNLQAATGLMGATGLGIASGSEEGWSPYVPRADLSENLEPLKSLLFWSDDSGDDSLSFEGFLQIG